MSTFYLRETINSKLRLVRTLSDTREYESYAHRSSSTIGMTLTLYETRKMLFLAVAHALGTMVVWAHFFLIKYRAQAKKVPRGAEAPSSGARPVETGAEHPSDRARRGNLAHRSRRGSRRRPRRSKAA